MRKDILQDAISSDLSEINEGLGFDIEYGESTDLHQQDIIYTSKGDARQSVDVGVGIRDYIEDDQTAEAIPEIKRQYSKDGLRIDKLIHNAGNFDIDAEYIN